MNRELIAFLIAAVAVPIFLTAVSFGGMPKSPFSAVFLAVSIFVSFCAVFLLGLPTYYFLQDKKWTAFWIARWRGSPWRRLLGMPSTSCWGWRL
jgi:hypothetical protein